MSRKPFVFMILVLGLAALACGMTAQSGDVPSGSEIARGEMDGEKLFNTYGCAECHDGKLGLAPSLHGVYGEEVSLEDGETVIADEAYLLESIQDPKARVVNGYQPIMPEFENRLNDEEVEALVEYIRSLSD